MMQTKITRKVTRWLVVALVFAQGAVAASACLAASSARVDAVASVSQDGCEMQRDNPNLCLYHCADQTNNGGAPQFIIFTPALVALPTPVWSGSVTPPTEAWAIVTRATGPPLPIRHCCFRI